MPYCSQTNYAVVPVRATFCKKCRVRCVLGIFVGFVSPNYRHIYLSLYQFTYTKLSQAISTNISGGHFVREWTSINYTIENWSTKELLFPGQGTFQSHLGGWSIKQKQHDEIQWFHPNHPIWIWALSWDIKNSGLRAVTQQSKSHPLKSSAKCRLMTRRTAAVIAVVFPTLKLTLLAANSQANDRFWKSVVRRDYIYIF